MAQQVKDLVVSLQQLGSLPWCESDPWSRTFHVPWVVPQEKKGGVYVCLTKSSVCTRDV